MKLLVKQLGDENFDTREAATKALVAMGKEVLPLLKKEVADSRDPEVLVRAKQIIDGVGSKGCATKARELWVEMIFQKKCKNWDEVIKLGQQALPLIQDEIQKKNIQALIDEAKKKKGG